MAFKRLVDNPSPSAIPKQGGDHEAFEEARKSGFKALRRSLERRKKRKSPPAAATSKRGPGGLLLARFPSTAHAPRGSVRPEPSGLASANWWPIDSRATAECDWT
jgi:hypothetical protein